MASLAIGIIVTLNANTKVLAQKKEAELQKAKAEEERKKAEQASEAAKIAQTKAEESDKKTQAMSEGRVKALSDLTKTNEKLTQSEADSKKQEEDTKLTLDNTQLLAENPTLSLKNAIKLYDSVNKKDLKKQLKKNAFAAYNEVLYTNEDTLARPATDIAVSYDRKTVLIADGTSIPKIWDVQTGTLRKLRGLLEPVTAVAAAPDKAHFVTVEVNFNKIFQWGKRIIDRF
jgi:hypothetical protein